ncbi:hypothetical protein [Microbulbifer sp.]|uniref:hypothetical protein n=1 Tax=Microbulbifer sp. TaxID=1908541 RepID=UPI00258F13B9|nr:hypothetical protein [Microbulbifer sp.]
MTWELLGNGCDKKFYVDAQGSGGYGAICCSDAVAARETKAYIDLKTIDLSPILPTILPWTGGSIRVQDAQQKPQYLIERLQIGCTFKPQMCVFQVSRKIKAELQKGDREKILEGLDLIEGNIEKICRIVGELTLAVCSVKGGLFMLDFSPGENKSTAIDQLDTIKKGLRNIRNAL